MLLTLTCSTRAQKRFGPLDAEDISFLLGALDGEYLLVGQKPASDLTYSGRVVLRHRGSGLEVTRTIQEKTVVGSAVLETVGADKNVVLVMSFSLDDQPHKATYLFHFDLDNDCRLTGYVYLAQASQEHKSPGLEVLFPNKKR
jgi:hypothetical protein